MPTVDVAFRPGDRAHIQQIREDVTVLAVSLPLSGEPQFECGYWLNGEWKRVWLPASELRARDPGTASQPAWKRCFAVMLNASENEHAPDWRCEGRFNYWFLAEEFAREQMKSGKWFGCEIVEEEPTP